MQLQNAEFYAFGVSVKSPTESTKPDISPPISQQKTITSQALLTTRVAVKAIR